MEVSSDGKFGVKGFFRCLLMLYPIVAKNLLNKFALSSSVGSILLLKLELRSGILVEFENLPFNHLEI